MKYEKPRYKIRMLKDIRPILKGQIIETSKYNARDLIEQGYAEYVEERNNE
jgi:hypothetical protein